MLVIYLRIIHQHNNNTESESRTMRGGDRDVIGTLEMRIWRLTEGMWWLDKLAVNRRSKESRKIRHSCELLAQEKRN